MCMVAQEKFQCLYCMHCRHIFEKIIDIYVQIISFKIRFKFTMLNKNGKWHANFIYPTQEKLNFTSIEYLCSQQEVRKSEP